MFRFKYRDAGRVFSSVKILIVEMFRYRYRYAYRVLYRYTYTFITLLQCCVRYENIVAV
jgi:hypothetical protein